MTDRPRSKPERGLPLRDHPLARASSLAELERIHGDVNGRVALEKLDRRASFAWEANRVVFGPLGILAGRYQGGVRGHSPVVEVHSIILARRGRGEARQEGRAAAFVPGKSAAIVSPPTPGEFLLGAGYESLQVAIPEAALRGVLGALAGGAPPPALRFDLAMDITRPEGATVARLIDLIVGEVDNSPMVLRSPLLTSHLTESLLCAVLLGPPYTASHLLRREARPAEPFYVKRIESYLEANQERHVSIEELAQLAGVGARAIHAGFRAHRGYTPMAFLRARRLEHARARLLCSPEATVATVALECGFEHLGRFSGAYRARFGESPAATLRGARVG
jgi:AraC-like DNA-binding protein